MSLTDPQKEAVAKWVEEGLSLSDIQKKLLDEFSISITYMDLRFLVDDLELQLKDSEKKPSAHDDLLSAGKGSSEPAGGAAEDLEPVGGVAVDVDKVTRPGMVVSGSVAFSDGVKGTWGLDQMGRLMLESSQKDYKPTQEDIEAFQKELSRELQKKGLA